MVIKNNPSCFFTAKPEQEASHTFKLEGAGWVVTDKIDDHGHH
jgi:hypothetical protein